MIWRYYVLAILLCAVSINALANSKANVRRFSPNEGLAQSYVTGLLVDKNGYLWVGTEAGVNRYDGYQLSTMTGAEGQLRDKSIDFLYEDKQNDIWISTTYSGLYRYKTDTYHLERVLDFKNDRTHSPVVMLETHQPNFYWLGRVHDLALLNSETGEVKSVFKIPGDFKYAYVRALKYYKHFLIIGTSEGAFVMDTRTEKIVKLEFLNEPAAHHDQYNTKSFHISGSQLWLGTVQGLHTVELDHIERLVAGEIDKLNSELRISDLNIWKIMPFKSGLKLATNEGVYNYFADDDQLIKSTELDNSDFKLSDNSIVDMLLSDDGSMWLASKTDGAYFVSNNNYSFQNYNRDTLYGGLSHNNIWSIVEHNKDIWLATSDGITRFNPYSYQSQTYLEGYLADRLNHEFHVYKMFSFNDKLWLVSTRGLFTFDLETLTISAVEMPFDKYKDMFSKQIVIGHFNDAGDMYFKSFRYGYFKYNVVTEELTQIHPDVKVIGDTFAGYFLPPLDDSKLPLFYHNKTLYQLMPDNTVEYRYTAPVPDEVEYLSLASYVIDNNSILWLSYYGYGLVGLDSTTFEEKYKIEDRVDTRGSLFYSLTKDQRGMIWMASHSGIWRFDPNTQHFRQFTVDDGIAVNEFNSAAKITYSDGRIVFGSIKGVTSFFPERNDANEHISERVNITSITLMSRKLEAESIIQQNLLELDYDDIGLEIGFSAMLFKYQERVEYEYRLDDSALVRTSNNKVAFARISPGKHIFYVRARDPLNGSYTDFKSFTIQVNYPPWRSPAAFAIYFILLASIVSVWMLRRHRYQTRLLAAHKQSSENATRLKMALQSSQSGVWEWQSGLGHSYQPRLVDELGFDKSEVSLDEYLAKIHPDDRARYRIEWLEFVSTDKGEFELAYRVRHSQGHWRWYKDVGRVIEWDEDVPQRVSGTYTNFTRERDFENSARLFSAAFEHTRDWVFVMDREFNILAINKALRESHHFDLKQDSARKLSLGLSAKRRTYYLRALGKLNGGEHYQSEETITSPDGTKYNCLIKATAIAAENGEVDNYIVVITDISSQKEAEQALYLLANYDKLTKLPNRSLFIDRVAHAISLNKNSEQLLAVLFIDLDQFKKVNDSFGHHDGDKLLVEIAERIKQVIDGKATAARLNSDEFTVLLENISSKEDIIALCQRLIAALKEPFALAGETVRITASIGVAIFPDDETTAINLIKAADIAMYHAKKRGGECFLFFQQEMNKKVQRLLRLESRLKQAHSENELSNQYQPIIDVNTGKVVGFETLMRWQHNGEAISPSRFIAIAENTGLITEMTMASLTRAVQDMQHWCEIDNDFYVSINLSAKDFHHHDLAEQIIALCNMYEVPCHMVALEITESVLMADFDSAKAAMDKLKSAGCRIYLDDFGTGYSSLAYLKRFPVDVIKIDGGFVRNIGDEADDEAIIRSTLALAKSLGKVCIAEGVESKEQLLFLQAEGCEYVQGYYFYSPLDASQVKSLLKR